MNCFHIHVAAHHALREREVLGRCEVGIQSAGVAEHRALGANAIGVADEIVTEDATRPTSGTERGREHSEERRLAASVVADDGDDLSRFHR